MRINNSSRRTLRSPSPSSQNRKRNVGTAAYARWSSVWAGRVHRYSSINVAAGRLTAVLSPQPINIPRRGELQTVCQRRIVYRECSAAQIIRTTTAAGKRKQSMITGPA